MAAIQSYLEDIKLIHQYTKDTVNGYIKNLQKLLANNNPYHNIPSLVIYWCLLFYGQESFDPNNIDYQNELCDNNTLITRGDNGYDSAFMLKIVDTGIHKWRFKIIKMHPSKYSLIVGVWKTKYPIKKSSEIIDPDGAGKFYGWYINENSLTRGDIDDYNEYGSASNEGDTITMILDLDQFTLSYMRNDTELGVAVRDIEETSYKVGVSIYKQDDSIQFIEYEEHYS